jgi:GR25 family glycosyltransferase involved in LPS biosynthesis
MNISDYFDRIYILHLDSLLDRKKSIIAQIKKFNLKNITIIDAYNKSDVNIHKLKEKELIAYGGNKYCKTAIINERGDKCWCGGRGHDDVCNYTGRVACAYSHYLTYQDMVAKKYKKCLILEDDFVLNDNVHELFNTLYGDIPEDWDLLYFGNISNRNVENHNNSFVKTKSGIHDSGCYAISDVCANNLYESFYPIRAAADGYLCVNIHKLFNIQNAYIYKKRLSTNGSLTLKLYKSEIDNFETTEQCMNDVDTLNNNLKKLVKQYDKTDVNSIYWAMT